MKNKAKKMRKYRVENIDKWSDPPIFVEAETARAAIKKALGIENVIQDRGGNILVKANVSRQDSPFARWQSWVYREVRND